MTDKKSLPTIEEIKTQLESVTKARGVAVELAWSTPVPGQKFVLMSQWDVGKAAPIWTLYENKNGESSMRWSQAFAPTEIDIVYDVLCMSTADDSQHASIPESLRPKKEEPEAPAASPANAAVTYNNLPPYPPVPYPYPAYPGYPPPYPGVPAPPYNTAVNPAPWPQPGVAPQPASMPTAQFPTSAPYTTLPAVTPASAATVPVDYSLISKRANVLLGKLLLEAGLISEPSLAAALKVQEYVRDERMSLAKAIEVLQRLHNAGDAVEDYLNAQDFDMTAKAKLAVQKALPADSAKAKIVHAALDLLQKAELIKPDDFKSAKIVQLKHGGDLSQILKAAGKLDDTTYQSAEKCAVLIQNKSMKVEQCIIALNYCNRMRVGIDAALEELGWQQPNQQKQ